MSASLFETTELRTRLTELRKRLAAEGFDGCAVLQRADLLYYTGAVFQGVLLVPAHGAPLIFAWRGASRIGRECPAEVREFGNLLQAAKAIADTDFRQWKKVGLEEDVLPVAIWKTVSSAWPHAQLTDVSPIIRWQRTVKSPVEIRYIRESARIMIESYTRIENLIRPGVREIDLQLALEHEMRLRGHQGFFRMRSFNSEALGVIASGDSASMAGVFDGPIGEIGRTPAAPVGASNRTIQRDTPLVIDSGAVVNGYHSDMTRTFVIGKLSEEFERAHVFCCDLMDEVARRLVPGAIPKEIYAHAINQVEKAGYSDNFMNRGALKARFIGHGIGLELDEWPVITKSFTQPLEKNMVLAIEPKIVFDHGAVGVEDTFLVTDAGGETITQMERGVIRVGADAER